MRKRLLLALLVAFSAAPVVAQDFGSAYYGKNRLAYENFAWKSYATEHFRVYFYSQGDTALKKAAGAAEAAYRKVSSALGYELHDPVSLICYAMDEGVEPADPFDASEGILGVSGAGPYRIFLRTDRDIPGLQSSVARELSRIFESEILRGSPDAALYALNQPPFWAFEGLSEYLAGEWSLWSMLALRDAVANDRIAEFSEAGDLRSRGPLSPALIKAFGHAFFEFIEARFGPSSVRAFIETLKESSPIFRPRDPPSKALAMESREFAAEFRRYLRMRFEDDPGRKIPADGAVPLGPEFPTASPFDSFSSAVSPSGDLVAAVTSGVPDGDLTIVLLSTDDGRVIRNLTPGLSASYESIPCETDLSLGGSLAWSSDGRRLALFVRSGRRPELVILDSESGAVLRKIPIIPARPSGPVFHPDGTAVLFSAVENGARDIFSLDLASEKVSNLTRDGFEEKSPALSPDGRSAAYVVRVGAYDKIFISPAGDFRKKLQLTFGRGNTIQPSFSADGRTLFFSGDAKDAYNFYSLSLDSGELRRFTDVRTGAFFPAPLVQAPGTLVFSAFHNGAFQIFKTSAPGAAEQTLTFADASPPETFAGREAVFPFEVDKDRIRAYRGWTGLSLAARLPAGAFVSSDGSIAGGVTLAFADVLGNRAFSVQASQIRDFRSIALDYTNSKRRIPWEVRVFRQTNYFYPELYNYDPRRWAAQDSGLALAAQTITGASTSALYPLSRHVRAEGRLGFFQYNGDYEAPSRFAATPAEASSYLLNGDSLAVSAAVTGETTRFKAFGPAAGGTFRLVVDWALPAAPKFLRHLTFEADVRRYIDLGADVLAAFRFRAFASFGRDPSIASYGGNNEVRSACFAGIQGTRYWYADAEIRFPLIHSASTILGRAGPVRGVLFFDVTRRRFRDDPALFYRLAAGWGPSGPSGRLDLAALGSYGCGFEAFVFGLPVHIEFARRLEWPSPSRPFKFSASGDYQARFWAGFDF